MLKEFILSLKKLFLVSRLHVDIFELNNIFGLNLAKEDMDKLSSFISFSVKKTRDPDLIKNPTEFNLFYYRLCQFHVSYLPDLEELTLDQRTIDVIAFLFETMTVAEQFETPEAIRFINNTSEAFIIKHGGGLIAVWDRAFNDCPFTHLHQKKDGNRDVLCLESIPDKDLSWVKEGEVTKASYAHSDDHHAIIRNAPVYSIRRFAEIARCVMHSNYFSEILHLHQGKLLREWVYDWLPQDLKKLDTKILTVLEKEAPIYSAILETETPSPLVTVHEDSIKDHASKYIEELRKEYLKLKEEGQEHIGIIFDERLFILEDFDGNVTKINAEDLDHPVFESDACWVCRNIDDNSVSYLSHSNYDLFPSKIVSITKA